MKKRVAAALLWFYVTWYAWAMVAALVGLPDLVGPVLGAAAAALIAGDPFHKVWTQAPKREALAEHAPISGARQTA